MKSVPPNTFRKETLTSEEAARRGREGTRVLERRGVLLTQAPRRRMEETSQEHAGGGGGGSTWIRGSEVRDDAGSKPSLKEKLSFQKDQINLEGAPVHC